jgi:hypothetical protein
MFIKHKFKFVKVIKHKKMVCRVEDALDGKWVREEMVETSQDGLRSIRNTNRARPYLADPYDSYWCDKAKSDPFDHPEDCPNCKPYDSYWNGFDLGFMSGSVNKIVVVDIDPRNIKGFTTIDNFLDNIEATYGELPPTWRVDTPSGGIHLYYKWPYQFKSNKGGWISGVDFLGENSWVKFPPATKESGGGYTWTTLPVLESLAELPSWIPRLHLQKVPEQPKVKVELPKYQKDDPSERVKVSSALEKLSAHNLDHEQRSTLAYCLFHNGYESEFLSWADSHGWKLKKSQTRAWAKAHTAKSIGYLFNLVKENC